MAEHRVSVFGIGVGAGANLARLADLSEQRVPVMLDGLSFVSSSAGCLHR